MPKGIPKNGVNKGWFKKGIVPWNKHTKGVVKPNSGSFTSEKMTNENHPLWKGEKPGYAAVHYWISRHWVKTPRCEHCGTIEAKRYEWANVSKEYKRIREDWLILCKSCHIKYDGSLYKAWETRRANAQLGVR